VAETSPQRVYRAACPGCGAPVEFRSAQSTHAVCTYCRSTVVRDGDTLSRLGRMAELFDDHSPLQLMASGRCGDKAFTLVGRLQYRSGSGTWTEWNAVFDDGSTAVLAEDNGAYVFARYETVQRELPPASALRVGRTTAIGGVSFSVASNEQGALISAQGELPKLPPVGSPFAMVELRSAQGEVLSIDYGTVPPVVTRGHAVQLDALAMSGLREENVKAEGARHFSCPNCGAPVGVLLDTSKSVTCPSCNGVIDVSKGIGGELLHAMQHEPVQPLIPLGSTGQLQGVRWQVVGFQHRMGTEPGDDDEQFGWSEYLLYQRKRGFVFLVDSEDGWSLVKPVTGAPTLSAGGNSAKYLGTSYQLLYAYNAETTYVAGEFYWPVERGHKSFNRDFASGASLLSMEETPREITWSLGTKIGSDTVAKAFGLEGKKNQLARSDASPVSMGAGGLGCMTIIVIVVVIVLLLVLMRACTSGGGGGGAWRSTGGSYGGYSSGGGHK
jgi:DNA-directed RNA polymerase subunit RPC12/RpoP